MTERHNGEIGRQSSKKGEVFSRLIHRSQSGLPIGQESPYAAVQQELILHLGGDWLPRHNRFQAVKKKLRVEQAAVRHRKVFGTDPQPTREAANGNVFDAGWHMLGDDNAVFHPAYSLALLRAGITGDGVKEKHRKDADRIFDKYLEVARQVIPSTGDLDIDEKHYHTAAVKALAKDMRPLITTDWVLFLVNLLQVED